MKITLNRRIKSSHIRLIEIVIPIIKINWSKQIQFTQKMYNIIL